jgi:nucleolin
LKNLFKDCGGIIDVRIAKDKDTGKMKGFAHVDFEAADSVQSAIAKNGTELDGRPLKIDASEAKSGGGRGGFGGGRGGGRGGRGGFGGGRGGGDPFVRSQKSGAILPPSGNVINFDD